MSAVDRGSVAVKDHFRDRAANNIALLRAVRNTSYYEYFPGGSRDVIGTEIMGLQNPPVPHEGYIAPPDGPG